MKNTLYLFLSILIFSGCYSPELGDLDRLVIREGQHRAQPYDLTWNNDSNLAYEWHLDQSMAYELGDRDQCDWSKLTGWSFDLFTNHQDAIMVAWRYDRAGHLLFSPYYHENGGTFWASAECTDINGKTVDRELPVLRAQVGNIIETHLILNRAERYTAVFVINKSSGDEIFWEKYWTIDIGNVREIYPWFGGNKYASQNIFFYRRLIGRE